MKKIRISQAGPKRFVFGIWQVIWPFLLVLGLGYLIVQHMHFQKKTAMMIKVTAGQIVQNYNDGLDKGVVWEGETKEEIILDVLDGKIVSSDGDALVVDIPKIVPPKLMLTELSAMITFDEHGHMRLNTSDQRS